MRARASSPRATPSTRSTRPQSTMRLPHSSAPMPVSVRGAHAACSRGQHSWNLTTVSWARPRRSASSSGRGGQQPRPGTRPAGVVGQRRHGVVDQVEGHRLRPGRDRQLDGLVDHRAGRGAGRPVEAHLLPARPPVGLAGVDLAQLALVDPQLLDGEGVGQRAQGRLQLEAEVVAEVGVETGPGLAHGEEVVEDPVLRRRRRETARRPVGQGRAVRSRRGGRGRRGRRRRRGPRMRASPTGSW